MLDDGSEYSFMKPLGTNILIKMYLGIEITNMMRIINQN